MGPWLGKRTRQCCQRRHHARPSPPTHDWVLRPLTRRASSSAPHVQGGLLSFPLGREEAMAAMASFGALALLLLSGLSCCSGSGLAGTCFGRAPAPWQVVLGEEGCARGRDMALPRARRYWRDLSSMGVVSCRVVPWRPKHHTQVYPAARLLEETSLSAFGRAPKKYHAPITSSSREGDMSLVPVSEGTRAVLASRSQCFIGQASPKES